MKREGIEGVEEEWIGGEEGDDRSLIFHIPIPRKSHGKVSKKVTTSKPRREP